MFWNETYKIIYSVGIHSNILSCKFRFKTFGLKLYPQHDLRVWSRSHGAYLTLVYIIWWPDLKGKNLHTRCICNMCAGILILVALRTVVLSYLRKKRGSRICFPLHCAWWNKFAHASQAIILNKLKNFEGISLWLLFRYMFEIRHVSVWTLAWPEPMTWADTKDQLGQNYNVFFWPGKTRLDMRGYEMG